MNHKTEKTINFFQLNFETTPKLRWVAESDPLLSKLLMDEFLAKKNAYGAIECNSANSKLKCFNKRRTYGIVVRLSILNDFFQIRFFFKIASFSCGIIINYEELIKSEGLVVVSKFLESTINCLNDEVKYICYDNACHLSGVNEILKEKKFVIDRFHLQNHTQNKCQTIYNCKSYPELEGLNTEICEQKFQNISKLKHQLKHMNKHRFKFFFLEYINLSNLKQVLKSKK